MTEASGKLDLKATYVNWVAEAQASDGEAGLKLAIGGEFEAFGVIQREMLRHYGLHENAYLIDVGCGSGRLASALKGDFKGRYLGLDVVPDLVSYTRDQMARADWRFEAVDGFRIPEADGCADMVCFFSVLTHLLHEQSYLYLEEAKRVLKPGGVIVFSFLEFAMDFHWNVFQSTIENERTSGLHPLNMFIERAAIQAWAKNLDLTIVDIKGGDLAFVPLPFAVTLDSGVKMEGFGNLGQSICALSCHQVSTSDDAPDGLLQAP